VSIVKLGLWCRDVEDLKAKLGRTRAELEAAIRAAIREAKGVYFPWRMTGFGIALLGSIVLAAANLVND
jgi:hypothetical protein